MTDSSIPSTMKAGVATDSGDDLDSLLCIRDDWPAPSVDSLKAGSMIIRVLACALAPGDVRLTTGKTDRFQLPDGGRPYVPGSDVAGIVVATHPDESKFAKDDYVVSRFDEPTPNGGLASYRVVLCHLSEKCPSAIPPTIACGLPASGVTVIAVSTQAELCKSLGAGMVLDYRTTRWWQSPELQRQKVDLVLDLVNGTENWPIGACSGLAVQSTGTYVQLLSGVETEIVGTTIWDIAKLIGGMVGRRLYSRLYQRVPKWETPEALKLEDGDLAELFQDVVDGKLKPLVDPASPFPFTKHGIVQAFELQRSKHAHGKVVATVAER